MTFLPDGVLDHLRTVVEEPDLSGTKYRLGERIGAGGMATVYEAEDVELGRRVAVKVAMVEPSPEIAARLRAEARILARLEHPGIVPVHDVGTLPDGRLYYVMKLVRGERLDEWIRGERPLSTTLRLFQRVCEAIAFAHAHDIVHLDVKPSNVTKHAHDEEPRVVMGTPGFMAPEQEKGEAVDARTDVYALGATLRHVLSQQSIPPRLASICAKATARDPGARYASALDLADDVGRHLDDLPVSAHKETIGERIFRIASRHRVVLTLFAVYLVVRVVLALFAR
jgi:eukaryotic-like serine/threonine-protein kinase